MRARPAGRPTTPHRTAAGASPALPELPVGIRWGWWRALEFARRNRMLTPAYLPLYARYLLHRLRRPDVRLEGMVFIGRDVELYARPGHGRLSVGAWSWIGNGCRLRAHEGNVRLGHKVVLGSSVVLNGYLDIEIGANSLLGDCVYIGDFDHAFARVDLPIKAQGLVKTPVRIGTDVWVGEKASVMRGADIGSGSVIGAHALVRGVIPPFSVAVGVPARVVRSRLPEGMTVGEGLALQRAGHPLPEEAPPGGRPRPTGTPAAE